MVNDYREKLLVADQLPAKFIYDLGLYLQTCAQIEAAVCRLILCIEERQNPAPLQPGRQYELRKKPIQDLLNQLKVACKAVEGDWGEFLEKLTKWIGDNKHNRHIAAHGAFYIENGSNFLKVDYIHSRKKDRKTVYDTEDTIIEKRLVWEMISNADSILRSLMSAEERIKSGEI